MPRMLRDHLCPQYEGTNCAQIKKDVISARILWEDLCPKCKGLFVPEKIRNFCAYNIGFLPLLTCLCLDALFTIFFVVAFCFDYYICVRVCLVKFS